MITATKGIGKYHIERYKIQLARQAKIIEDYLATKDTIKDIAKRHVCSDMLVSQSISRYLRKENTTKVFQSKINDMLSERSEYIVSNWLKLSTYEMGLVLGITKQQVLRIGRDKLGLGRKPHVSKLGTLHYKTI